MNRLRKVGLAAVLAATVVAGSALGGGLLSAGAATTSTTPSSTQQTAPPDDGPRGHHCRHGQGQGAPSQDSQPNSATGSATQS
jgi:Spy/CpxP family protein refolding chaperone